MIWYPKKIVRSGKTRKKPQKIDWPKCKECNKSIRSKTNHKRLFCSNKCMTKHHKRIAKKMRRARLKTLAIDFVNPIVVFNNYNWHCANCGIETPRSLLGKNKPNSPELDHIIPLSKLGDHSYVNTQLLCKACNGKKGNRVLSQTGT